MGAVTDHLLRENEKLLRLVLEAAGDGRLGDDYMAQVIAVLRGPEKADEFRECRGEWEGRTPRPGAERQYRRPPTQRKKKPYRIPSSKES